MSTWERVASLAVEIEDYELEGLTAAIAGGFERRTTVIRLAGGSHEGVGEDVTYAGEDHEALQAAGAILPLAGRYTLASLSAHLADLDLFPQPAQREDFQRYRTWAYESAALDLALRQADTTLYHVLGRTPQPVSFVASVRLGEPPSMEPIRQRLMRQPGLHFKLDPTSSWDESLIAELVATAAVDSLDFKGHYHGTVVDQPADAALYERVSEAFPDAWIEDPALTPETDPVLLPHRDRIVWDAPIHSVADIEALPFPPKMVNIKPSRLGALRTLLDTYDYCAARGINNYGGGQSELGPGRGQIQYLASLFHSGTPNDVAPSDYNLPDPPDVLPASPLQPAPSRLGFRWDEYAG